MVDMSCECRKGSQIGIGGEDRLCIRICLGRIRALAGRADIDAAGANKAVPRCRNSCVLLGFRFFNPLLGNQDQRRGALRFRRLLCGRIRLGGLTAFARSLR